MAEFNFQIILTLLAGEEEEEEETVEPDAPPLGNGRIISFKQDEFGTGWIQKEIGQLEFS